MDPMTMMAIAGAVTGIGGALSGNRDQRQGARGAMDKLRESRSYNELGAKDPLQQRLEDDSYFNYIRQDTLQSQMEQDLARRQGLQNQAGGYYDDILSGRAFGPTADELSRSQSIMDRDVDYQTGQINQFLDERLGQNDADAARRGLRGQAAEQVRGQSVTAAADMLQDRLNQAATRNDARVNNAMSQRLGYQQNAAGQMQNYQQQLLQQAMMNRQALQNPVMLQNLRNDRQFQATRVAPHAAYGQAVMMDANTPSDLTAGLMGLNSALGGGGLSALLPSGGGGGGGPTGGPTVANAQAQNANMPLAGGLSGNWLSSGGF